MLGLSNLLCELLLLVLDLVVVLLQECLSFLLVHLVRLVHLGFEVEASSLVESESGVPDIHRAIIGACEDVV